MFEATVSKPHRATGKPFDLAPILGILVAAALGFLLSPNDDCPTALYESAAFDNQ